MKMAMTKCMYVYLVIIVSCCYLQSLHQTSRQAPARLGTFLVALSLELHEIIMRHVTEIGWVEEGGSYTHKFKNH